MRRRARIACSREGIDAPRALEWGLVCAVVEAGELADRARQLAQDIAGNDQPGVRAMLALYGDGAGLSEAEAAQLEVARAVDWQGEGFDAAEIGRRFDAIKARGRAQRAARSEKA